MVNKGEYEEDDDDDDALEEDENNDSDSVDTTPENLLLCVNSLLVKSVYIRTIHKPIGLAEQRARRTSHAARP